jgi:Arc/MetJ-type ribon-helix-helix transcriptional regulator
MTIQLSREREQVILSLLQTGKFASADEVIDEALRLVGQRYQEPGETKKPAAVGKAEDSLDRTGQQLENLRRLGRKLDAMPSVAIADGMSNRDHDRILYGQ